VPCLLAVHIAKHHKLGPLTESTDSLAAKDREKDYHETAERSQLILAVALVPEGTRLPVWSKNLNGMKWRGLGFCTGSVLK
jgi:hypothetical protein